MRILGPDVPEPGRSQLHRGALPFGVPAGAPRRAIRGAAAAGAIVLAAAILVARAGGPGSSPTEGGWSGDARWVDTRGVGSAEVGSTRYSIPKGAVFVAPDGSDNAAGTRAAPVASLARAVGLSPSGGTVVLRGGVYSESAAITKPVTVQAYPGEPVWLDGSRPVTGFVRDGAAWRVDGWSVVLDHSPTYKRGAPDGTAPGWSFVSPEHPAAAYPDQVWVAGVELAQVLDRSQVKAGTFYVDTARQRLYLGSDPTGASVRASVLGTALTVTAPDVTLRGFGVRRYATSVSMMGTVRVYGERVRLEDVVIQDNATQGLSLSATDATVRDVTVEHNGLLGMHANYADGLRVDGLLARQNNTEHFNKSPVSGGVKITKTRSLVVRDSAFVGNDGSGFWVDQSTYDGVLVGNDVVGNSGNGVVLEISQRFVVADNVVRDNGLAGLRLDATGGVEIWNNSFARNARDVTIVQGTRTQFDLSQQGHDPRRPLPDPTVPWRSADIDLHNNIFDNSTGDALLAVEDYTHRYSASDLAVTADNNIYVRDHPDSPEWLVVWARAGDDPATYSTREEFAADTGQERSTGPAQLPPPLARLVGRPVSPPQIGAWR